MEDSPREALNETYGYRIPWAFLRECRSSSQCRGDPPAVGGGNSRWRTSLLDIPHSPGLPSGAYSPKGIGDGRAPTSCNHVY